MSSNRPIQPRTAFSIAEPSRSLQVVDDDRFNSAAPASASQHLSVTPSEATTRLSSFYDAYYNLGSAESINEGIEAEDSVRPTVLSQSTSSSSSSTSSSSKGGDASSRLVKAHRPKLSLNLSGTSSYNNDDEHKPVASTSRIPVHDPSSSTLHLGTTLSDPFRPTNTSGWHIHHSPIDMSQVSQATTVRPSSPVQRNRDADPLGNEKSRARDHPDTRPFSVISYGDASSMRTDSIHSNDHDTSRESLDQEAQFARVSLTTPSRRRSRDPDRDHWEGLGMDRIDDEEAMKTPLRTSFNQNLPLPNPASKETKLGRRRTVGEQVGKGLKKMSDRVVGFADAAHDPNTAHQRLHDEDEDQQARLERAYKQLRGKSLGLFGPEHWLRQGCRIILVNSITEPFVLLLIIASVVILTIQNAPNVYTYPKPSTGYFHQWEDYALLAIFSAFTFEMFFRIIVAGFIFNPPAVESFSVMIREPLHDNTTHLTGSKVRDRSPVRPPRSPTNKDPYAPLPSPRAGEVSIVSAVVNKLKPSGTSHAPRSPRSPSSPSRSFALRDPSPSPSKLTSIQSLEAPRIPVAEYPNPFDERVYKDDNASPPGETPPRRLQNMSTSSSLLSSAKAPFASTMQRQRAMLYSRAYLRHSWNRLDLVAIASFWIGFALSMSGIPARDGPYIFRAMSVLRAMRLLGVTTGTNTIIHSLKRASGQLVRVGLFVAFAMILFSIIGVQSFQGSFRRNCRWIDLTGELAPVDLEQPCGGFYNATSGMTQGAVSASGQTTIDRPKGYICPPPMICIATGNPDDGSLSFDNIFASMYQIVIISSANTWSTVMYDMMSTDYFVSCLFFIIGVIVMNYWLLNLFVAVITHTFAAIREETKRSAFTSESVETQVRVTTGGDDEKLNIAARGFNRTARWVNIAYTKTSLIWVAVALASITCQALTTYDTSADMLSLLRTIELYITVAFAVEIFIRFYAAMPDWRSFFSSTRNLVDVFLVIATSIIQIPVIKNSEAYPWLTCYQIARFYRVILAIPRMKRLLTRVLGTFKGLMNMILFLILMTYIASLVALQLFRGVPDPNASITTDMTFYQSFNAFLAMYQVLSSENWTDVVNNVVSAEGGIFRIAVATIFLSCWLLFGWFILISMFIAVINENFDIPEEEKRKRQREVFESRNDEPVKKKRWWHKFKPYKLDLSLDDDTSPVITSRDVKKNEEAWQPNVRSHGAKTSLGRESSFGDSLFGKARRALGLSSASSEHESVALEDMNGDDTQIYQGTLFHVTSAAERDAQLAEARAKQRRAKLAAYIASRPSYDRSLWFISQKNWLRRFCQKFVDPASGEERLFGREAQPFPRLAFQTLIFAAIVGSVVDAAIATPYYRRDYFIEHGVLRWTWFNLTEAALGLIFVLEFLVKVIADGFMFGPNAYLDSIYNDLDFWVLLTLITNIVTSMVDGAALTRFTRAVKAFRALRLINLWPQMRITFYNVLIVGFSRIIDAEILAVFYIIPFAVWGQQVFSGKLYSCNDGSVSFKNQCAGEFSSAVVSDWAFLQPRVWDNPNGNPSVWSFDTFGSSLLILFEIISLEGWIDVLFSVMQITGQDQQPQQNASQFSGLFFVLFNLIGAVFILTLFVSTIIENFTLRNGTSLLTTEQLQWTNLRKLIARQRPAGRPQQRPTSSFRAWCFDRAIDKHGWWSRGMTTLYCLNIVVLCTQATTNIAWADDVRNFIFLGFTVLYCVDVTVRLYGVGWKTFMKNGWNRYDVIVTLGTLATTILVLYHTRGQTALELQKLFLVSIAFKLVQKNNSLNELFKTAVSSLPTILNIFSLWIVLFLVWAIFVVEVFGLTRWQSPQTYLSNYSTFMKALVLLALQSTGEGWNAYMHSYEFDFPRCTTSPNYVENDCGSSGGALLLFISWNVLSMYLMSNLILGAVIETFSYVFHSFSHVNYPDREQMREYKQIWSEIDTQRSGYIRRREIPKFFGRLDGIFEVRIYRREWTIKSLKDAATTHGHQYANSDPELRGYQRIERDAATIDVHRLSFAMRMIDDGEVRARRFLYNRLYHEAMIEADRDERGISFNGMLMLLAYYRMIDGDKALRVDELLERQESQARIRERVDSDLVRGLLQTAMLRRRFLTRRSGGRLPPEIRIDDAGENPPPLAASAQVGPNALDIDTGNLSRTWEDESASSGVSSRDASPTRSEGFFRGAEKKSMSGKAEE